MLVALKQGLSIAGVEAKSAGSEVQIKTARLAGFKTMSTKQILGWVKSVQTDYEIHRKGPLEPKARVTSLSGLKALPYSHHNFAQAPMNPVLLLCSNISLFLTYKLLFNIA